MSLFEEIYSTSADHQDPIVFSVQTQHSYQLHTVQLLLTIPPLMNVVCLKSKNPMLVLKQSDSPVLSVPLLLTSFSQQWRYLKYQQVCSISLVY